MALALYQLKAHLEEQKALQDLGTMVSAAENLPTLKLANLQQLAAQGAPRDTTTSIVTPAPPPPPLKPPAASASWPGAADESEEDELTAAAPHLAAAMAAFSSASAPAALASPGPSLEVPAPPQSASSPRAPGPDWKKLAKAEVNPRWFWMVTAAAAGVLLVVVAFFALRARAVSRPTAEPDAVLEQSVKDRRQSLEETKKLFAAGKYEESLARARQVLSRSPNNAEARRYAQMAESAVQGRQAEEGRKKQAAGLVAAAKTALAGGKPDEARQKSEEALALDAGNTEAAAVRDEAGTMIVEAKVAAEAAARKKGAKARDAQQTATKKKNVPAPSSSARSAAAAAAPVATVPETATLRVTLDAPIPDGNIMVAVNDKILLRNHFSFKKGEARNVSLNVSVPSGAAAIKVWLSGPDMPSAFATTSAQLSGGDTKTLQLDYSSEKLSVRLQ
jgi:hypothetical protein